VKLRFQADADLDARVIRGLKRVAPRIDIRTAAASGLRGLSDAAVLRKSAVDGRVLVSQDRKTMPRHFEEFIKAETSPGMILLRGGIPIGSAIDELVLIWDASEAEEWVNRLVWIPI
jgi:hypothetical protein